MTDVVRTFALAGGLDEMTPDALARPGIVRRSINYEVVVEGGYRRVGGYKRWAGIDVTAEPDAIEVIEVPTLTEAPEFTGQKTESGVEFRAIGNVEREDSSLLIVEKARATSRFTVGDTFISTALGSVIDPRPVLTDPEREIAFGIIDRYGGRRVARAANGTGSVAMIQPSRDTVIVARVGDGRATFSRSARESGAFPRGGAWIESGEITDVKDDARLSSIAYQFAGRDAEVYVATGTTVAHRITHPAGVIKGEAFPIVVPNVTASPTHVTVHRNHLFLAYPGGRIIHSATGDPTIFDAIEGTKELSVGDEITGFQALPGDALAIYCRDRISILSGSSGLDWRIDLYTDAAGAIDGTLQNMPTAIFCDRRAISTLAASDTHGNFRSKALSQLFDPTYQRIRRGSRLLSLVSREKSQYRVFNEDGRGLYLTFSGNGLAGGMEVDIGRRITATGSLDSDEETLLFGSDDGFLYQLDAGSQLLFRAVDAFIETADHDYRTPRRRKRFKQAVLEVEGDPRVGLDVTPVLDAGHDDQADMASAAVVVEGRTAPRFRDDLLARFTQRFTALAYLIGTGRSMALQIEPTTPHGHTIKSVSTHFTPRGQDR